MLTSHTCLQALAVVAGLGLAAPQARASGFIVESFLGGQNFERLCATVVIDGVESCIMNDGPFVGGTDCADVPPVYVHATESCPLLSGGTCVSLTGVNAQAEKLRVYASGKLIAEWTPGQPPPPLNLQAGTWLAATQQIGGIEGCLPSSGPMVGHMAPWWPFRVALCIRETGQTSGEIGSDGGVSGTLEWVGATHKVGDAPVGKLVEARYGWQMLTFNCCTGDNRDPVVAFTGNGVVEGTYGVLEGLGITIEDPEGTAFYSFVIDSVANGATMLCDFEMTPQPPGSPVMFRKPRFSAVSAMNLLDYPDMATVDSWFAADGSLQSCKVQFQFYDGLPTRWVHLTTRDDAGTPDMPLQNPLIDLTQPITIKIKRPGPFHPEPVMDVDVDGDVDMVDFAGLQRCLTIGRNIYGGWIEPEPHCYRFDFDYDSQVNELDLALFLECSRGSGLSPEPQPGCGY